MKLAPVEINFTRAIELETRLELATYALQVRCATNCATPAPRIEPLRRIVPEQASGRKHWGGPCVAQPQRIECKQESQSVFKGLLRVIYFRAEGAF